MAYRDKHIASVVCGWCGELTTDYKPVVIRNKPKWACKKDCSGTTTKAGVVK